MNTPIESQDTKLAACPRCSSRINVVRPEWAYARHTSERRGVRCYLWIGQCRHADAFYRTKAPVDEPAEMAATAARWAAHAAELFTELTVRWTPAQRALHARTLGITLPPDEPAQEQQHEPHEK